MNCPLCNHTNLPSAIFCGQCGSRLAQKDDVEVCSVCSAVMTPGSKFCGQCGNRQDASRACLACGQPLAPGSLFCGECGAPVIADASLTPPSESLPTQIGDETPTPSGHVADGNLLRHLMPDGLVAKMQSEAGLISGERREVSVLFATVSGLQGPNHSLDSEDIYMITDEVMRLLVQIVYQFEGTVDKFTGSGLMALFGAPVAHENDPERAIHAALAMLESLKPLQKRCQTEFSLDFHARIGVNTGPVTAGSLGSDLHMEYTVIGDTVNLASRLQDNADEETALVSHATFERTRALFNFHNLPPIRVKGKPNPIRVYQPIGQRAFPDRVRGLAGLSVPMIGRQEMLEELVQTWRMVEVQKRRQVALVTGDAGLGKTRLVAEVRQQIEPIAQIYQGNCLNHTQSTPFWLLGALLRDMLNLGEAETAQVYQESIASALEALGLHVSGLMPYILNILGVEQPSTDLTMRLAMLDAAMLQQQTHTVLHQVIWAAARQKDIVLILEDIHWIDSASRNFLVEFLRSSRDMPIFILLVSRTHERSSVIQPIVAALEKDPNWDVDIELQALSPDQEYALIDQLISQAGVQIPGIHSHIARRAEGNPFYIEEIVRMLLDRLSDHKTAAEENEGTADGSEAQMKKMDLDTLMASVPASLGGLILARFDNLSEQLRHVMQFAAVIGRSFSLSLLQRMTQIEESSLMELLTELVTRHFLVEEVVSGKISFSFRHALVQEAVYNTLLHKRRRQIHGAVAVALETSQFLPIDERTEALAYHYSHSEQPNQAISYLVTAAQNATRRSAYESSLQFYRRALALFELDPDPNSDSDAFSPIYGQICVGMGVGLKFSGAFEEALQLLLRGHEYLRKHLDLNVYLGQDPVGDLPLFLENLRELADVCQRAGNFTAAHEYMKEALSLAAPFGESPLWYSLLERTAWIQFRLGELEQCSRLAREAIGHLEDRPEEQPFTLARFYNTMGGVAWQQGNLAEAITYVEGSLKMYEPQGFVWGISVACANLGILHWTLGHWAVGIEWYERAVKIQEENGFSFERATALRNLGYLRLAQGDTEIAHHQFEQSLDLCLQHSHSYGALTTHLALGAWAVAIGDAAELNRHVEAAQSYAESADTESQIMLHLLKAQNFAQQKDFASAIKWGNQALGLATEGGMQAELIEANYTLGVIYGKTGTFEKADHHLMTAQHLADERNAPDRVANAQLELASLYEQRMHTAAADMAENWKQEALGLVRAAIACYEQLGARLKLRQANSLQEKLVYYSNYSGLHDPLPLSDSAREPASGIHSANSASQRVGATAHPQSSGGLPNNGSPDGEKVRVTTLWLVIEVRDVGDEEEMFSQTAEALGRASQFIRESGGHIIRHPVGLAAIYGAPIAYEDGPTRALHCAAKIGVYLDELVRSSSGMLIYGMGLDHGDAVVGYLDASNRSLIMITGEPMERSKRLAQAAPSGSIWLSHALSRLTAKDFVFRSLKPTAGLQRENEGGKDAQENVDETDEAVEFVSARKAEEAHDNYKQRTRLIGRDTVLDSLLERGRELKEQNEGGFVWLEGDAGIGKSRLLAEFCDISYGSNSFVWRGNCSSQSTQQPFLLFSTLLHDIFGFEAADSTEDQRKKLSSQLSKWNVSSHELQPYLELLCGVPPAPQDAQRLANLEPEALRRQIFVTVRSLLVGMMQQRPLILVLDDIHWLDPMSASLLVFLSHMAASMPVLFLFAYRPTESEIILDELNAIRTLFDKRSQQINLTRLGKTDSHLLLSELLPSGKLSLDAYRFILERSDGNPYYMEEFLRLLIEQGYLQQEGTIWSPQAAISLITLPLPVTLEALIRSRVDSLPTQQRQMLQWAAVIGRPFPQHLLAKMISGPVDVHIQALSRRNLLNVTPDEQELQFNHHIAQIVVYNSMLRVRLKALHAQVAAVLEEEWGAAAGEHAEELAHHLTLAEEGGRALPYLVIAGGRAEARHANDEALAHYSKAREILRNRVGVVADKLQWQVIVGLGDTYRFVGKYDLSIAALEEGLELLQRNKLEIWRKAGIFRRLGQTCAAQGKSELAYDHFRQALVMLEEPSDREGQIEAAQTLYFLTYTHSRRGQWEKAKETCEMCYIYAEKSSDLSEMAAVENLRGGIAYQQGEREEAIYHTEKALELRERAGYTWGVAATTSNLAILAGESGDWDRAKRHFQRSLQLRQDLGDTEGVAIVNNNLGWLDRIKGDLDGAEAYFRESLRVAELFKMVYHTANALLGIGHIRQLKGDIDEAHLVISASLDKAEQVDARGLLSEIYRVQADILLDRGAAKEAEERARSSVLLATETGSTTLEAEAWRVVSESLIRQGDLRRAEEAIALALSAQADNTNTIESGRVAIQSGRLLRALGRIEEAQAEFERADTILRRMDAQYDLQILARERSVSIDAGKTLTSKVE